MKARFRRSEAGDRGAVAVEFAIIALLAFIPLIAGLVELGFAYQSQISLNQAARSSARLAAVCGSSCVSQSSIEDAAGLTNVGAADKKINVTYCAGSPPTKCIGDPSVQGAFSFCPAGSTQSTGSIEVSIFFRDKLTFALLPNSVAPNYNLIGIASMPCGG